MRWKDKDECNYSICSDWVYVELNIDFLFYLKRKFSTSKCIKVTFYYFLSRQNMGIEIHSYIFWTNMKGHFQISGNTAVDPYQMIKIIKPP